MFGLFSTIIKRDKERCLRTVFTLFFSGVDVCLKFYLVMCPLSQTTFPVPRLHTVIVTRSEQRLHTEYVRHLLDDILMNIFLALYLLFFSFFNLRHEHESSELALIIWAPEQPSSRTQTLELLCLDFYIRGIKRVPFLSLCIWWSLCHISYLTQHNKLFLAYVFDEKRIYIYYI